MKNLDNILPTLMLVPVSPQTPSRPDSPPPTKSAVSQIKGPVMLDFSILESFVPSRPCTALNKIKNTISLLIIIAIKDLRFINVITGLLLLIPLQFAIKTTTYTQVFSTAPVRFVL